MSTPSLLIASETCQRKGFYSRDWEAQRLPSKDMLLRAISEGLTTPREDFGEAAGEKVMDLAENRGLDVEGTVYDAVVSLAAVADLVTCALRKPKEAPWGIPEPIKVGSRLWQPTCFAVGGSLRRLALVSNWSDNRHYGEARSWDSLGNVCVYGIPMQQVVIILGPTRDGTRRGPWTKCFQHPLSKVIRFRKKSRSTSEVFKDSWKEIWRVDHAEISNEKWLEAMLKDDVLPDVCFNVNIPVPEEKHRIRILEMAEKKLERIYGMKERPEANLSSCDWPSKCQFHGSCNTIPERPPSEKNGYLKISS